MLKELTYINKNEPSWNIDTKKPSNWQSLENDETQTERKNVEMFDNVVERVFFITHLDPGGPGETAHETQNRHHCTLYSDIAISN